MRALASSTSRDLILSKFGPIALLPYAQQVEEKLSLIRQEFSSFRINEIDVFTSPDTGFRMRAEFGVWHENDMVHYAMFEPGVKKRPYTIYSYDIGSPILQTAMSAVRSFLNSSPLMRERLFQVDFLTSTVGEVIVTLIYRRKLDDIWRACAQEMSSTLGVHIIGRSRKQKLIITRDYIHEHFHVEGREFRYKQIEGAFSQPNAYICERMLGWVNSQLRTESADLLELYCGNGNFTLPLSTRFNRVLATEISKVSLAAAVENSALNNISNISFVRLSSEELTQALNHVRLFNRLKDLDLDDFHFSTVFVDPPRAGLDSGTIELIQRFHRIIYISCNPVTLKNNLLALQDKFRVVRMAFFDQFPHTHHREIGVVMEAVN